MYAAALFVAFACRLPPAECTDVFYADADRDGYGDPATASIECSRGKHQVASGEDCDDANAAVNPEAAETCNGRDDDCDGTTDVDAVDATTFYVDEDGDGFGGTKTTLACALEAGITSVSGDCDDYDSDAHPDAREICNDIDDDCDGVVDVEDCEISLSEANVVFRAGTGGWNWSLAAADVDADGTPDLLAGTHLGAPPTGAVYVLFGPLSHLPAEGGIATITTTIGGASLGSDVAGGDADGDGIDDVLVGAFGNHARSAYLFLGPMTGDCDIAEADATLTGPQSLTGASVDVLGDVDGDGTNDVLVDSSFAATVPGTGAAGEVYIASGAASGIVAVDTDSEYTFSGQDREYLGVSTAGGDDLNGDGLADLVLGSEGADGFQGAVYIVPGGLAPGAYDAAAVADAIVVGVDLMRLGMSVASVDYDQDGTIDLLAGAPRASAVAQYSGAAFAFLGQLSGEITPASADVIWQCDEEDALFGGAIAVGDVDGDTTPDILVHSGTSVYLQLGLASGVVDVAALVSFPAVSRIDSNAGGSPIAIVPDWDGDGASEIAVTASGADVEDAIYVFPSELF